MLLVSSPLYLTRKNKIKCLPHLRKVPPNIDDQQTSTGKTFLKISLLSDIIMFFFLNLDIVVREGANVKMKCSANGSPLPTIKWLVNFVWIFNMF